MQTEISEKSFQFEDLELDPETLAFLKERNAILESHIDIDTGEYYPVVVFEHNLSLPLSLPDGLGFSGGTARTICLSALGERFIPPRDFDIVVFEDFTNQEIDINELDKLTSIYQPDEKYRMDITNLDNYFMTRDFVMNEVAVIGKKVYVTPAGLMDLKHKQIRPTKIEQNEWHSKQDERTGVRPKLVMKALRLYLELNLMYGKGEISGIEAWQFTLEEIPYFWIALNLEKAMSRGERMTAHFFRALLDLGLITTKYSLKEATLRADTPEELAYELRWHMLQEEYEPFNFSREELNKFSDDPNADREERYLQIAEEWERNHLNT